MPTGHTGEWSVKLLLFLRKDTSNLLKGPPPCAFSTSPVFEIWVPNLLFHWHCSLQCSHPLQLAQSFRAGVISIPLISDLHITQSNPRSDHFPLLPQDTFKLLSLVLQKKLYILALAWLHMFLSHSCGFYSPATLDFIPFLTPHCHSPLLDLCPHRFFIWNAPPLVPTQLQLFSFGRIQILHPPWGNLISSRTHPFPFLPGTWLVLHYSMLLQMWPGVLQLPVKA